MFRLNEHDDCLQKKLKLTTNILSSHSKLPAPSNPLQTSRSQLPASRYTEFIKQEALRLGFLSCGISKAGFLQEEAPRLENWLNQNHHGEMKYMENHFDKRLDPTKLVEGSKSVISLLLNYFPEETQRTDSYKISKYAYGTVTVSPPHVFHVHVVDAIGKLANEFHVIDALVSEV